MDFYVYKSIIFKTSKLYCSHSYIEHVVRHRVQSIEKNDLRVYSAWMEIFKITRNKRIENDSKLF